MKEYILVKRDQRRDVAIGSMDDIDAGIYQEAVESKLKRCLKIEVPKRDASSLPGLDYR